MLDLPDLASVRARGPLACEQLRFRLDCLINNAGVDGTPRQAQPTMAFRAAISAPTTGPLRLTTALLPLLAERAGARVVRSPLGRHVSFGPPPFVN